MGKYTPLLLDSRALAQNAGGLCLELLAATSWVIGSIGSRRHVGRGFLHVMLVFLHDLRRSGRCTIYMAAFQKRKTLYERAFLPLVQSRANMRNARHQEAFHSIDSLERTRVLHVLLYLQQFSSSLLFSLLACSKYSSRQRPRFCPADGIPGLATDRSVASGLRKDNSPDYYPVIFIFMGESEKNSCEMAFAASFGKGTMQTRLHPQPGYSQKSNFGHDASPCYSLELPRPQVKFS